MYSGFQNWGGVMGANFPRLIFVRGMNSFKVIFNTVQMKVCREFKTVF